MKHREVNGEWVCACDPICDNCERRFRCLDAGPANSILQGKGLAPRRFDTIAKKPLIAAQMLALDQERERVAGENAKLREALEMVEAVMCDKELCGHFLPEEIRAITRQALKEGL